MPSVADFIRTYTASCLYLEEKNAGLLTSCFMTVRSADLTVLYLLLTARSADQPHRLTS